MVELCHLLVHFECFILVFWCTAQAALANTSHSHMYQVPQAKHVLCCAKLYLKKKTLSPCWEWSSYHYTKHTLKSEHKFEAEHFWIYSFFWLQKPCYNFDENSVFSQCTGHWIYYGFDINLISTRLVWTDHDQHVECKII